MTLLQPLSWVHHGSHQHAGPGTADEYLSSRFVNNDLLGPAEVPRAVSGGSDEAAAGLT